MWFTEFLHHRVVFYCCTVGLPATAELYFLFLLPWLLFKINIWKETLSYICYYLIPVKKKASIWSCYILKAILYYMFSNCCWIWRCKQMLSYTNCKFLKIRHKFTKAGVILSTEILWPVWKVWQVWLTNDEASFWSQTHYCTWAKHQIPFSLSIVLTAEVIIKKEMLEMSKNSCKHWNCPSDKLWLKV